MKAMVQKNRIASSTATTKHMRRTHLCTELVGRCLKAKIPGTKRMSPSTSDKVGPSSYHVGSATDSRNGNNTTIANPRGETNENTGRNATSVACQIPRAILLNRDCVCQYSTTSSGVIGLPFACAGVGSFPEPWFRAPPVGGVKGKALEACSWGTASVRKVATAASNELAVPCAVAPRSRGLPIDSEPTEPAAFKIFFARWFWIPLIDQTLPWMMANRLAMIASPASI